MGDFLKLTKSSFNYHVEDAYSNYLQEVLEKNLSNKAIGEVILGSLKELDFDLDIEDVRLSDDEDFNPGPFVYAGLPLIVGGGDFSLLPSSVGTGSGNRTPYVGLVAQHDDVTHAGGFRWGMPIDLPIDNRYEFFIGEFEMPEKLKGVSQDVVEPLLTYFLGCLSYGLAVAFAEYGLSGYRKESEDFLAFIHQLWAEYITSLEEVLAGN